MFPLKKSSIKIINVLNSTYGKNSQCVGTASLFLDSYNGDTTGLVEDFKVKKDENSAEVCKKLALLFIEIARVSGCSKLYFQRHKHLQSIFQDQVKTGKEQLFVINFDSVSNSSTVAGSPSS